MDQGSRFACFVADWLGPCAVVAVAFLLGLVLFASEEPWWPVMAGPAAGVVAGSDGAAIGHR